MDFFFRGTLPRPLDQLRHLNSFRTSKSIPVRQHYPGSGQRFQPTNVSIEEGSGVSKLEAWLQSLHPLNVLQRAPVVKTRPLNSGAWEIRSQVCQEAELALIISGY